MATKTALFNTEKMIFWIANMFMQDPIHDFLKLKERPKLALSNSPKTYQKYAKSGKSPTNSPISPFTFPGYEGGGTSKSGGGLAKGCSDFIECLIQMPPSIKLGFYVKLVDDIKNGVKSISELNRLMTVLGEENYYDLLNIYNTYKLLSKLNGQCNLMNFPKFFVEHNRLSSGQQSGACEGFETLIFDTDRINEMYDEMGQGPTVEINYGRAVFFHGDIFKTTEVIDIDSEKRGQLSSSLTGRQSLLNFYIQLSNEWGPTNIYIIGIVDDMGKLERIDSLKVESVIFGGGIASYEANTANFLFQDEGSQDQVGKVYSKTMIQCNTQEQLSAWILYNYSPTTIRNQIFNTYTYIKTIYNEVPTIFKVLEKYTYTYIKTIYNEVPTIFKVLEKNEGSPQIFTLMEVDKEQPQIFQNVQLSEDQYIYVNSMGVEIDPNEGSPQIFTLMEVDEEQPQIFQNVQLSEDQYIYVNSMGVEIDPIEKRTDCDLREDNDIKKCSDDDSDEEEESGMGSQFGNPNEVKSMADHDAEYLQSTGQMSPNNTGPFQFGNTGPFQFGQGGRKKTRKKGKKNINKKTKRKYK